MLFFVLLNESAEAVRVEGMLRQPSVTDSNLLHLAEKEIASYLTIGTDKTRKVKKSKMKNMVINWVPIGNAALFMSSLTFVICMLFCCIEHCLPDMPERGKEMV